MDPFMANVHAAQAGLTRYPDKDYHKPPPVTAVCIGGPYDGQTHTSADGTLMATESIGDGIQTHHYRIVRFGPDDSDTRAAFVLRSITSNGAVEMMLKAYRPVVQQ